MSYCNNCGKAVVSGSRFCSSCGQRIASDSRSQVTGKTCPYCQVPLKSGEESFNCPKCETPHHLECWRENNGCTVFGCNASETFTPSIDLSSYERSTSTSATNTSIPQGPIKSYLAHAILVTLFCCIPFGIPAIVYAAQVNSKIAVGDYQGAKTSSDNAKTWCIVSLLVGIVAGFFIVLGF